MNRHCQRKTNLCIPDKEICNMPIIKSDAANDLLSIINYVGCSIRWTAYFWERKVRVTS